MVTQCMLFSYSSSPFLEESLFLKYIAIWSTSQPSTCTVTNLHLNAYPIKVLLEMVECAAGCGGTV